MRRISLVLIILITLGTVSASAGQGRRQREDRGTVKWVIGVVKSVFKIQTNSDVLMPPLPAPAPPSHP